MSYQKPNQLQFSTRTNELQLRENIPLTLLPPCSSHMLFSEVLETNRDINPMETISDPTPSCHCHWTYEETMVQTFLLPTQIPLYQLISCLDPIMPNHPQKYLNFWWQLGLPGISISFVNQSTECDQSVQTSGRKFPSFQITSSR